MYKPTTGTFASLDPFEGNKKDPQSMHKYGYVHGDPVNHVDPTGETSLGEMNVTSGTIAKMTVLTAPAIFGAVNAGYGYMTGQMDATTAIRSFGKYALLNGIGVGAGFAMLAYPAIGVGLAGSAVILGGIAMYNGKDLEGIMDGFAQLFGVNPDNTMEKYKSSLIIAAEQHDLPFELVASVLRAEGGDYGYKDFLGDDIVLWGAEEHSMGIAQIRVDTVRNWGLMLPEWEEKGLDPKTMPAHQIRRALLNPGDAIWLMAEGIKYNIEQGVRPDHLIGIHVGVGVQAEYRNWLQEWNNGNLDEMTKLKLLDFFGGAKDDFNGYLVNAGQLSGATVNAYQQLKLKGYFN